MGSAAAAQTAAIFPTEYCGTRTASSIGIGAPRSAVRSGAAMVATGAVLSGWESMGRRYGRGGALSSAEGRVRCPPAGRCRLLLWSEAGRAHVGYVRGVSRLLSFARSHGLDLLVVVAAVESALEVGLKHDALREPRTTAWFARPAAALIGLPLLCRRRWRFAAPAAVWLLGAAVSLVDGRLVEFSAGITTAGLAASFLLGNLRDVVEGRIGLAIVLTSASIVVYNDPNHAAGRFAVLPAPFGIARLARLPPPRRARP